MGLIVGVGTGNGKEFMVTEPVFDAGGHYGEATNGEGKEFMVGRTHISTGAMGDDCIDR